jgi:transcriptional regulator with XRE-family HTH domain
MSTQKAKRITVAEYLSGAIGLSGKTQREISQEIGYENPNVLTLMKQGKTKLPINKVQALAKALGVDQANFLRIVMSEYMPEAWDVIKSVVGEKVVSADQTELLGIVDLETGGLGVDLSDEKFVTDLRTALREHHKRNKADLAAGAAAIKRGRG